MELTEGFIDTPGCKHFIQRLTVTTEAQLPTLIFLHDALGSVAQWKDFPVQLVEAMQLNALIIERQGHGKSSPFSSPRTTNYLHLEAFEVLPNLLDLLGIKHPILVGHSDGASIALLYASKYAVQGIISIAAHIFVEDLTVNSIRSLTKDPLPTIAKLFKYQGNYAAQLFEAWSATWLSTEFQDFNIEQELQHIKAPILIIQSKDDEYGTLAQVESIYKQVNSNFKKILFLKTGGHAPHLKESHKIVQEITSFFNANTIKK